MELATDEDRAHGIDRWARLFKSTTWEEIKMIAENNSILTEASETLYTYNAEIEFLRAQVAALGRAKPANQRLEQ